MFSNHWHPGGMGNTPPVTPSQGNNGGSGCTGGSSGYGGGGGGATAAGTGSPDWRCLLDLLW